MANKGKRQVIDKPVWLKMTEEELKKLIVELADKYQPAQIGLILRDQYGVPTTRVFGKKLSAYLKEMGKESNTEIKNVEQKVHIMKEHLKRNVQDKKAKHKIQKANSRLNKMKKYFSN
jgi:small subunit ribosomal protein S15